MELDQIFKTFSERIAEIELLRRAGKDVATGEFKKYQELAQRAEQDPDRALLYSSIHAMHFYDAQTGEAVVYSGRKVSAEDRVKMVGERKNREYCWLLVEAYEEFEDYIERVYAFIGKREAEAWPLGDFGNVRLSELKCKDFDWYLETVKRPHRRPKEILNRLRAVYPDLETVERANKLGVNLRIALELIESLRHKVVHARGVVADLEEFTKGVLERSGLWNGGKPNGDHRTFVQRYLRPHPDGGHLVTLLEVQAAPNIVSIEIVYPVFRGLIGYLLTYARLIRLSANGMSIPAKPGAGD